MKIPGTILLNALAGSHAHGLNIEWSDEDYRGVYIADMTDFYALNFPSEVSDETNDRSYFELSKFSDLLLKNNPTVLEFLCYPERCILEKHPAFDLFRQEDYLTKQCQHSFIGYALGQIRRAYKLKKRISIPDTEVKKTPFDFCKVITEGTCIPFKESGISLAGHSVSDLDPGKDLYTIWKNSESEISFNEDNFLIGKSEGERVAGYLLFERAAFSRYLKEYKSFFQWKEARDINTQSEHADGYDGKLLMHTFRLLYTAKDIATKGEFIIERPEKDFLLSIRFQQHKFSSLIKNAEDLVEEVRELFQKSTLPNEVNVKLHYERVAEIRAQVYLEK